MGEIAVTFLTAFGLGLAATFAAEALAPRIGLVTAPREDRWHRRPIPLLGGIGIMLGVLPALVLVGGAAARFGGFLLVALVMGLVGLFDDVRSLGPPAKLVLQIVLAALLVHLGFVLRLTGYEIADLFLTLLWIVAITNAFNLLDNMDGLAAGMALIAAGFRLTFFVLDGDRAAAGLMAGFGGAAAGFLVRNFPPAKIFMGDAGSLFIGFFLAGACLAGDFPYSRGMTAVIVIPVLLMLIPIFDTTFVTVTRLLTGRSVAQGGRDHTSHRLVSLGVTERGALGLLYGLSVLAGLLAVLSYQYGLNYTVIFLALLLVALVLLAVQLARVHILAPDGSRVDGPAVSLVADFPFKRHLATVAIDLVLIVTAYHSAYLLRFEDGFEAQRAMFAATVAPLIVLQISSLAIFGSYRGLWRYTSLPELLALLRGATVGVTAVVLYFLFAMRFEGLSRAVFVLYWLLLVLFLGASRLSFRLLGEWLRPARKDFRRVLIYGAGDGGELMLRELRKNGALQRHPVGFIDDDPGKVGTRIHEVPVLGNLESVDHLLATHRIVEVVVASEKIPGERLRRLEALCAPHQVAVARASVRIE